MTTASCISRIEIRRLSMTFGFGAERLQALSEVSLSVPAGQLVCVLGPSGCGKSTLLEAVAGHRAPSSGAVLVNDEPCSGPHPQRGLVFQQHTLFPWRRVIDNVAFGLKMQGIGRDERDRLARELLRVVGLTGFETHYPAQLSGGMQQRVELARVLINQPSVLLMDEPFGALDAQTRHAMQGLLLEVWSRLQATVLFVTHDVDEALFLADRIVVMTHRPGRVVEDLLVDLPRPRTAMLASTSQFVRLKQRCIELIRRESSPALETTLYGGADVAEHFATTAA